MKKSLVICLFTCFSIVLNAQFPSGPMLSYNTMREAAIWIQADKECMLNARYYPVNDASDAQYSATVKTAAADRYTATLVLTDLEPGTTYRVDLMLDGTAVPNQKTLQFTTQPLWQYRTDPPEFTFAAGSCVYINETEYDRPGTPYGSEYEIFGSIAAQKPDFMLWLGDNTYLREADWSARSSIFARYAHTRQNPEMQALLSSTHHYAIWDDHDYGPNDADRSFARKTDTREAFMKFWPSPSYGVNGLEGTTQHFTWADVDYFMLDDRWYRTPQYKNAAEREILGQQQLEWLKDALKASQEDKNKNFRVICVGTQFLSTAESKENFSLCPSERDSLMNFIQREGIKNVVFLTGDRHHSELSTYMPSGAIPIYDFTVSALTSGSNTKADKETNHFRMDGSVVMQHNYALITVKGKRTERMMILRLMDKNGKELFRYEINAQY